MDDTTKGAGIGAITGAILAVAAKKLAAGDKPLSWKDYALWGGIGSAVGGTAGAAIMLPSGAGIGDEQKRELEKEKAELEEKLDGLPSRGNAVYKTLGYTGAGAVSGTALDHFATWLHRGLYTNLKRGRIAGQLKKARSLNRQIAAVAKHVAGLKKANAPIKNIRAATARLKKLKVQAAVIPGRGQYSTKLVVGKNGPRTVGVRGAGWGSLFGLALGLWHNAGDILNPPGSKDRDRQDQIDADLEKLKK